MSDFQFHAAGTTTINITETTTQSTKTQSVALNSGTSILLVAASTAATTLNLLEVPTPLKEVDEKFGMVSDLNRFLCVRLVWPTIRK